jgi:hypothetical protein
MEVSRRAPIRRMRQDASVRLLICDSEGDLAHMVEVIAERVGHEVVGMPDSLQTAEGLMRATRPEVIVLDPALGFGSDFDLVDQAVSVGAQVILFSHTANEYSLDRYDPRPLVVRKPDLTGLEEVLRTVEPATPSRDPGDRRQRPQRSATGRPPVGPTDNEAFFEAISGAQGGDVLVWIDFSAVATQMDAEVVHRMIMGASRSGDRLVLSPTSIRGFLPGAGDEGAASFWSRLESQELLLPGVTVQAVVVSEGEHPNDAFDRLRRTVGS